MEYNLSCISFKYLIITLTEEYFKHYVRKILLGLVKLLPSFGQFNNPEIRQVLISPTD